MVVIKSSIEADMVSLRSLGKSWQCRTGGMGNLRAQDRVQAGLSPELDFLSVKNALPASALNRYYPYNTQGWRVIVLFAVGCAVCLVV